jgi:hypothetical protein
VDMSEACATTTDMPPNRAVVLTSLAKSFITEFFDQNPLSQMSVQVMRHGRVDTLSELSASMGKHVHVLEGSISTGGAISLQNMLDAAIQVTLPSISVVLGDGGSIQLEKQDTAVYWSFVAVHPHTYLQAFDQSHCLICDPYDTLPCHHSCDLRLCDGRIYSLSHVIPTQCERVSCESAQNVQYQCVL